MNHIGQGIAFMSLVVAATVLEIYGKEAAGLWVLVVLWAVLGEWGYKKKESED